jgi:hypothetical protein
MDHFINQYADRLNQLLHFASPASRFFKQEIIEVPELLTSILVTYDGVRDDERQFRTGVSWEDFLARMAIVKPDWIHFDRSLMERLREQPEKALCGWEGRTIYFIRGGHNADQWTPAKAKEDCIPLLIASTVGLAKLMQLETESLRECLPVGAEHFQEFEYTVRVTFNFLFRGQLREGRPQSRTEPENEGVEMRDLLFSNISDAGFWKDLKDKYSTSEIVVDAKNKDELTRDDLRQLYCYLKPALGFWGFIVCRSEQPRWVHAFNRTLFKNFNQARGLLVLCDDDLRRMVQIKNRGQDPSEYLQERMADFIRSI